MSESHLLYIPPDREFSVHNSIRYNSCHAYLTQIVGNMCFQHVGMPDLPLGEKNMLHPYWMPDGVYFLLEGRGETRRRQDDGTGLPYGTRQVIVRYEIWEQAYGGQCCISMLRNCTK